MLTWRWVGTRSNGFGHSIVSQATVPIVRKRTFRGDHGGSDSTPVVRPGWIRYPRLRVRMVVAGRVDRMMMPRCVRRVIAPALGKTLMTGRHGWIGSTGSGPASGRRCCRYTGWVVRLVIRGRTGGTSRPSGSGCGRPEAKGSPNLPVVPRGTGGRGGISRQVVIRRGVITPVSLMMVQRFARCWRVMGVLGMVRAVTPAALWPRRRWVRVSYHARRAGTTRTRGLYAGDFPVSGTTASRCRR